MPATASTPSGPHSGDLGPDLREGSQRYGRDDGVKYLEQVSSLPLAEVPDSFGILPHRFPHDIALRSGQSGGCLAKPIHRLLIEGECELYHTKTILPYLPTVKRDSWQPPRPSPLGRVSPS